MMRFPQIGNGSIAQYPFHRVRTWRPITNQLENREVIRLADNAADEIRWRLSYEELTDAESGSLTDLFVAVNGRYGAFLFIDPLANLLGWSEDLSRPDWQPGLLQISAGAIDPLGTQRGSSVHNTAAGAQMLQQSIALPGDYAACLSVWMRGNATAEVTVGRDGLTASCEVGPVWKRFFVSGIGVAGAVQSTFSLSIASGQTIDLWGVQAEAQPHPSQYKQSASAAGIYDETYFTDDELHMVSTGVGLSSCQIQLTSRIH
jgi:hypothetical protein